MNFGAIVRLLEERTGLTPEALGPSVLPAVLAERVRALGLGGVGDYAAHLAQSAEEFQTLIDSLVVSETWFFRGGDLFHFLADRARGWLTGPGLGKGPFRVLSVPCSTGEEPLSLLIAFRERGLPADSFAIDAVDLSSRAIARARAGVYPEFSFRQAEPEFRERYFRTRGREWEVDPALRDAVRYRVGNLIEPGFLAGVAPFQLVFCRNLFLYLSPEGRRCALTNLERLLAPDGILCTGPTEPSRLDRQRLRPVGPPEYFLYSPVAPGLQTPSPTSYFFRPRAPRVKQLPAPPPQAVPPPPVAAEDLLTRARREADQGRLLEALQSSQRHLDSAGASAAVYYLLGVLHEALHDRDEAVLCLERALYLDPDHKDALLHLMLLRQQRGEVGRAALLRRRLERLQPGGRS